MTPYGKVTNTTIKRHIQESQEANPFQAGLQDTDKTIWEIQMTIKKELQKNCHLGTASKKLLEGLNKFHCANLTLNSDVDLAT